MVVTSSPCFLLLPSWQDMQLTTPFGNWILLDNFSMGR